MLLEASARLLQHHSVQWHTQSLATLQGVQELFSGGMSPSCMLRSVDFGALFVRWALVEEGLACGGGGGAGRPLSDRWMAVARAVATAFAVRNLLTLAAACVSCARRNGAAHTSVLQAFMAAHVHRRALGGGGGLEVAFATALTTMWAVDDVSIVAGDDRRMGSMLRGLFDSMGSRNTSSSSNDNSVHVGAVDDISSSSSSVLRAVLRGILLQLAQPLEHHFQVFMLVWGTATPAEQECRQRRRREQGLLPTAFGADPATLFDELPGDIADVGECSDDDGGSGGVVVIIVVGIVNR